MPRLALIFILVRLRGPTGVIGSRRQNL